METKWIVDLISHPCSDQSEEVFQQTGVVLSVQVRQGALLSDWCIWVLNKQTQTRNVFLTPCVRVPSPGLRGKSVPAQ